MMSESFHVTEKHRLEWPPSRPRIPAEDRRLAPFRVDLWQALGALRDELRRLGAEDAVATAGHAAWLEPAPLPFSRTRADPAVAVWFTLDGRRICLACDRWTSLRDNIRACGLILAALRGLDRWGAEGTSLMAVQGLAALPATTGSDWPTLLGVPPDADRAAIDAAWLRLARAHHPDVGGDAESFRRIAAAYHQAKQETAIPA